MVRMQQQQVLTKMISSIMSCTDLAISTVQIELLLIASLAALVD